MLKYCSDLDKKAKAALDKAGVSDYNVNKISSYAEEKYSHGEYNETYTEYRTANVLKRRANK